MPALEVVREVVVLTVAPDDLGVPLIEQSEGAPGASDVYRLPQPVEDEHVPVEQGLHD